MKTTRRAVIVLLGFIDLSVVALAQDILPAKEDYKALKKEYSPYVGDHFPNQVLFCDTHLHTSWSADLGMAGATRGPDVAYRVFRGETVTSHTGWKMKPVRPWTGHTRIGIGDVY